MKESGGSASSSPLPASQTRASSGKTKEASPLPPARAPAPASPVEAGAQAAKPSGVPSCVTACTTAKHRPVAQQQPASGGEESPFPSMMPAPTPKAQVKQRVKAAATARAPKGGSSQAVATVSSTVVVQTPQPVERQVVERPVQEQPEAEMVPTPAPQPVQTPVAEQPVAAVAPVPTITQTPEPVAVAPAQPVMVPLPATGNAAASSILGSTALIGATYWYLRSRKQLLRSSRRHASGPQT
jgi:hypothetical protein